MRKRMRIQFHKLLSLPKTLFFNFYYFPFAQAIKFPLIVSYSCIVKNLGKRGSVKLSQVSRGIVQIGIHDGSFSMGNEKSCFWDIQENAQLEFQGKCLISRGCRITVCKNAKLTFGEDFYANSGFIVSAAKDIRFGDDCLLGWNCCVIDGDGHQIVSTEDETILNSPKSVVIGNHVWLSSNSTVLKGSSIESGSIVAAHACVSSRFNEKNVLVGGLPAKVMKRNVTWNHQIPN